MPPKQKQNTDSRLELLKREIAELKEKYDAQTETFVHHGQRIEAINARIGNIDQRFDRMQDVNDILELEDRFILRSDLNSIEKDTDASEAQLNVMHDVTDQFNLSADFKMNETSKARIDVSKIRNGVSASKAQLIVTSCNAIETDCNMDNGLLQLEHSQLKKTQSDVNDCTMVEVLKKTQSDVDGCTLVEVLKKIQATAKRIGKGL